MQGRTGCGNLARLMSPVRADDIWRRGWDWLARFASSPLTCSFAAALVEQGSHPQPHSASKKNGDILHFLEMQNVPILFYWRWSESYAEDALRFNSRQPP